MSTRTTSSLKLTAALSFTRTYQNSQRRKMNRKFIFSGVYKRLSMISFHPQAEALIELFSVDRHPFLVNM